MSYLQRKTNYAHGVTVFLHKHNVTTTHKSYKLNSILVEFLKSQGLLYFKWNHRYKGLNNAYIKNSETIQDNWSLFRDWVINTKTKKL